MQIWSNVLADIIVAAIAIKDRAIKTDSSYWRYSAFSLHRIAPRVVFS